jgi:hypothetical protein
MIFEYTTIASIRSYGVTALQMSDIKVKKLIMQYSQLLNRWTELWFAPIATKERFSGGGKLINISGKPPLIKLNAINIINIDGSRTPIEPGYYESLGKSIRFAKRTPEGIRNVEVDGVFGLVDSPKEVHVKTTTDIAKDSISFSVEDASLLEERDIFVFGNRCIIANSINYENNTISIDKQGEIKTIQAGTEIICYGQCNMLVEEAVNLLVKNYKILKGQIGGGIKTEKTDDYSYEVFELKGNTTGITEVDRIVNILNNDSTIIEYL